MELQILQDARWGGEVHGEERVGRRKLHHMRKEVREFRYAELKVERGS